MKETSITKIFAPNWVFRLYLQRKPPYYVVVLIAALAPLAIGAVIALILGVFREYVYNPLTYFGPGLIILVLIADYWFVSAFPRTIIRFAPSINISEAALLAILKKWADKVANRTEIMILAGIPIALIGLQDTISLWTTPTRLWMGTPWVQSTYPIFFASIYVFYFSISVGFLLGSGAVGLIGVALLITDLLKKPLKLEYVEDLRAILDLSVGVGLWAFLALALTIIGTNIIKPTESPTLLASSLILSILASVLMLIAFLSPIFPAHEAILEAKRKKLKIYKKLLHDISVQIDQLWAEARKTPKDVQNSQDNIMEKHKRLRDEREELKHQIEEIESIPVWPISFGNIAQMLTAAVVTPLLGQLPEFIIGKIKNLFP
jgi:Uncharacterized protein conserved in bacteria